MNRPSTPQGATPPTPRLDKEEPELATGEDDIAPEDDGDDAADDEGALPVEPE